MERFFLMCVFILPKKTEPENSQIKTKINILQFEHSNKQIQSFFFVFQRSYETQLFLKKTLEIFKNSSKIQRFKNSELINL